MSLFLAPQSWPFLLALVLLVAIVVVEGLALVLGFSISGLLHDISPDLHTEEPSGIFDAWLGWLHVGKVPLLVVLAVMLTAFSMVGFLINGLAHAFPEAQILAELFYRRRAVDVYAEDGKDPFDGHIRRFLGKLTSFIFCTLLPLFAH